MTDLIKVTAAILMKYGKVFIAKRKTNDKLPNKWEFPGGKVDKGETPRQCLEREMREEFGIRVTAGEYLGSNIYHYDHVSIELLAFRAYWNEGDITLRDHAEYKWIKIEELLKYDFAPADLPFVKRLRRGEIELRS